MPVERINRYKKTPRLRFRNEQTEQNYQAFQHDRGRSSGVFALSTLAALNLVFAFLEHWILGLNSTVPLFAYLGMALVSVAAVLFSLTSESKAMLMARILAPGVLTFFILLSAVYFEQYRIYHAIEMALLVIWFGSINKLGLRSSALVNLVLILAFIGVSYLHDASGLKMSGLLALMAAAFILGVYLSYMQERLRRMMFLTNTVLRDVHDRQESWAYTLIDLDMALSGIRDFKELIGRMMEYIKSVIDYDSFVLTSLEGKGPKPQPDQMDGTLFEQDDQTLWSDDLLTKLSQTRQATASSQFEMEKGFLGREKKKFLHFRLDIPVFNDSNLIGVISLRRKSGPFDDLDMTASVSLAAQAMMIFKRTTKSSQMSASLRQSQAAPAAPKATVTQPVSKPQPKPQQVPKKPETAEKYFEESVSTVDLDITGDPTLANQTKMGSGQRDETVVPQAVIQKIRQDTETARKTITLLSRENADQIAVDRYRTAAVEGEPLSILLVEVDGLSALRERDGDQAAYKVFAGIVKYVFGKTDKERDVLGRYGQNGFSVLLPRVDMNAAEKFAESIRQFAENNKFKTPYGERGATLSIGVASITDETGNYDSMVKRADMALFVAKKNGRNCVKVRL